MKKITKVELKNCKAYVKTYSIDIDNGKNLLIYGENGSGKSSLYRAIDYFFKNSIKDQNFEKNIFNESEDGYIIIEFADYNGSEIEESSKEKFRFSSFISNNKISFIQEATLIKGFLDYTDLLNIYLKSSPNPNLFSLVVENLLKDFIPLVAGATIPIGKSYHQIKKDLLNSYTRRDNVHRIALRKLTSFERELRGTLDRIFEKVNELLNNYFGFNELRIDYLLQPITMNYGTGRKATWSVNNDLRLVLKKGDFDLGIEYKEKLNEARLSSIAICIYLSSLILYPKNSELKLLYLDDIFVGLDSSNRLPILEIIKNQFQDFQIIISTYDKSFFNIANLKLNREKWTSFEFYVGTDVINEQQIEIPIITESKDDYGKAKYHLYNSIPDYPASANYFRKSIEELLSSYFPKFLFKDGDYLNVETYKLSTTFKLVQNFLINSGLDISEIDSLRDYIYILLHPLSHYQIDAAEYKSDLINIEKLIQKLYDTLPQMQLTTRFKCVLERNCKIKLELFVDSNNIHVYHFLTQEDLILDQSTNELINCKLFAYRMYNKDTSNLESNIFTPNKTDIRFFYTSLKDAYFKISDYLVSNEEPSLTSNINFLDSYKMLKNEDWIDITF